MITSHLSPENQMSKRCLDTAARSNAEQTSSFRTLVLGHGSLAFPTHHDQFASPRIQTPLVLHHPNRKVPASYFPLFKNVLAKASRKITPSVLQRESTFAPKKSNRWNMQTQPRIPFPAEALRRSPEPSGFPSPLRHAT